MVQFEILNFAHSKNTEGSQNL